MEEKSLRVGKMEEKVTVEGATSVKETEVKERTPSLVKSVMSKVTGEKPREPQ